RSVRRLGLHARGAAYVARPRYPVSYWLCSVREHAPGNDKGLQALATIDSGSALLAGFCSRWDAVRHRSAVSGAAEKTHLKGQRYVVVAQERKVWRSIS